MERAFTRKCKIFEPIGPNGNPTYSSTFNPPKRVEPHREPFRQRSEPGSGSILDSVYRWWKIPFLLAWFFGSIHLQIDFLGPGLGLDSDSRIDEIVSGILKFRTDNLRYSKFSMSRDAHFKTSSLYFSLSVSSLIQNGIDYMEFTSKLVDPFVTRHQIDLHGEGFW